VRRSEPEGERDESDVTTKWTWGDASLSMQTAHRASIPLARRASGEVRHKASIDWEKKQAYDQYISLDGLSNTKQREER